MAVDRLQGEEMLQKALKILPKVSAWLEARQLGRMRNRRETSALAKFIDCIISSPDILRAKDELAV